MAKGGTGLSHGDDLGMGGGIVIGFATVVAGADDARGRLVNDDTANRYFVGSQRQVRLLNGLPHPVVCIRHVGF